MSARQGLKTWVGGLCCGVLVLGAVLIARPFAEMGFIDDWAYVKVAEVFARRGHVVYNGWETAMLGWIIPWGALFVRAFGYSFTAVRLSTLPLVFASVMLFHASLRRFGASPRNAVIGTLTLGLSPVFVPMAATYMTDVPGLFCILVCLYLCQRAVQARTDGSAAAWLIAATATNLVGGTVRQIVWLGALVMVPSTTWYLRRRRYVPAIGAGCWVASVVGVLLCIRWFEQQPYVLPEKIYQGVASKHMLAHGATEMLKSLLCLALLMLPLLMAWASYFRKLSRPAAAAIAGVVAALGAAAVVFALHGSLSARVMPWIGHIVGTQSIFRSTGEMLGERPVTLDLPARTAISFLVIVMLLLFVAFLLRQRNWHRYRAALWLLAPFTTCYVLLLVPRAIYSFVYDRYLLGVMPAAIVMLVLLYQERMDGALPRRCLITLACFAVYTVAATHDWFALNRARIAAVHEVESRGVPATSIQGGFDYDGWTEIEAVGYINDARLQRPAHAYRAYVDPMPSPCRLNFASFTPAIKPRFFVVFHPMPCLEVSGFPDITYRTWLPPFQRSIYVEKRPGA